MRKNGGYATFQQLNHMIDFSDWKSKTPQASVRRIVQVNDEFFKVRPGLWALSELKNEVLKKLDIIENDKESNDQFSHSYYQGILVELGNLHDFGTYIPNQDKNKMFIDKRLSDLSSVKTIPHFSYDSITNRARTIDVIWFNDRGMPHGFYEVEHTTNISNSLEKFCDLQDFRAKFVIVADESRRKQFNSILERSAYKEIRSFISFFNYESLVLQYEKECSLATIDRLY